MKESNIIEKCEIRWSLAESKGDFLTWFAVGWSVEEEGSVEWLAIGWWDWDLVKQEVTELDHML